MGFAARLGKNLAHSVIVCTIRFMTNHIFKSGASRDQASLLPARVEDYVDCDNPVRAIDAFVDALDLAISASGMPGRTVGRPAAL